MLGHFDFVRPFLIIDLVLLRGPYNRDNQKNPSILPMFTLPMFTRGELEWINARYLT